MLLPRPAKCDTLCEICISFVCKYESFRAAEFFCSFFWQRMGSLDSRWQLLARDNGVGAMQEVWSRNRMRGRRSARGKRKLRNGERVVVDWLTRREEIGERLVALSDGATRFSCITRESERGRERKRRLGEREIDKQRAEVACRERGRERERRARRSHWKYECKTCRKCWGSIVTHTVTRTRTHTHMQIYILTTKTSFSIRHIRFVVCFFRALSMAPGGRSESLGTYAY